MGVPARQHDLPPVTVAEFLAWDDGTDTRYELVAGVIVAMTPAHEAHGILVTNLGTAIHGRLKAPCRVVTEAGIRLFDRDDRYYQADLVVTCQPSTLGRRYPKAPQVILEILSPSTAAHDRGIKLPDYRRLPSVQEIVLLSSTSLQAEIWRRSGAEWSVADVAGVDARLSLPSLHIDLPLSVLYENVVLEQTAAGETAGLR